MKNYYKSLIAGIIITLTCSTSAIAQFAGGTGTAEDPWQVETIEHLNKVRDYLGQEHADKHFRQTGNITVADGLTNPIGSSSSPFYGMYDGGGFIINQIELYRPENNYVGLFGYIKEARLSDVHLRNVMINGYRYVGGLVGYAEDSIIENASVTGELIAWNRDAGGLAGIIEGGRASRVSAMVDISGGYRTGGLAGLITAEAKLHYAYTDGSVEGTYDVGGFAGSISSDALVSDAYSHASVFGGTLQSIGGFAGNLNHSRHLYRAYSTGSVVTEGETNGGGFLGSRNLTRSATYCFWDVTNSGYSSTAGAETVFGLTQEQMKSADSFPMFNFMNAWQIDEGNSYPEFRDFNQYSTLEFISLSELNGTGMSNDPYVITDKNELFAMHQDLNAHYRLDDDIDLISSVIWDTGRGWLPLGDEDLPFTGSFDGQGFSINGLTINRPGTDHQGLFGYTVGADIQNLHLQNTHVNGGQKTGGLVGYAETSTLKKVSVTGHVISSWGYTGGIIGHLNNSVLEEAAVDVLLHGSAKNRAYAGGVAGVVSNGAQVRYASSEGMIRVHYENSASGGFVGSISNQETIITDSFSHATVNGLNIAGGFAGSQSFGTIGYSYSTGSVHGTGDSVGGFLGQRTGGGAIHSYWDMETSGQSTSAGGDDVKGRTTAEMTFPHSENTFQDWDFDTIWTADEDHSENSGYPYLDGGMPTSTGDGNELPERVVLHSNYPNPFNPSTNIRYELPRQQDVRIEVFNLLGRRIAVLVNESQQAGMHTITFDGSDLSSGMYLFRLQTDGFVNTRKMMLVK